MARGAAAARARCVMYRWRGTGLLGWLRRNWNVGRQACPAGGFTLEGQMLHIWHPCTSSMCRMRFGLNCVIYVRACV